MAKKSKKTMQRIRSALSSKPKLIQAPPDKEFYLTDGRRLKDIKELLSALQNMPGYVFQYHVNEQKDDFATWIKDVLKNRRLASKLQKVKEQEKYTQEIEDMIKTL